MLPAVPCLTLVSCIFTPPISQHFHATADTMANALTLETMSPGLVKVVETCNHEPHRRKSRMREIRSYGSGEGPGWVTSRPTLQRPFPPAVCAPPVPCHLAAHPPAPPSTLPSASAAAAGCRAAGAAGAARGDGCTRDERCLQRRVQTLWHMRRRCGGLLLGTVVQRETGAHACGRGARGHASREAITAASLGRYAAPGDAAGAPLDSRVPR